MLQCRRHFHYLTFSVSYKSNYLYLTVGQELYSFNKNLTNKLKEDNTRQKEKINVSLNRMYCVFEAYFFFVSKSAFFFFFFVVFYYYSNLQCT